MQQCKHAVKHVQMSGHKKLSNCSVQIKRPKQTVGWDVFLLKCLWRFDFHPSLPSLLMQICSTYTTQMPGNLRTVNTPAAQTKSCFREIVWLLNAMTLPFKMKGILPKSFLLFQTFSFSPLAAVRPSPLMVSQLLKLSENTWPREALKSCLQIPEGALPLSWH